MKYAVNHRFDEKELHEMTDAEFAQLIDRQPVHYRGASSAGFHPVSWDVWDEISRRANLRKLLSRMQQGFC